MACIHIKLKQIQLRTTKDTPSSNSVSIDETIRQQEDAVAKARTEYDTKIGKLKDG